MLATVESKEIYGIGEIPPLGLVPGKMHGWVIRKDRHGEPRKSFQREQVPVPEIGPDEVLVWVAAAGVNYNGVWAGLGEPISVLDVHKKPYHIAGSDVAGVVWKVGSAVRNWKVGDEVIAHCNISCGQCEHCNGGDPMYCVEERIWGYETPDGSFAQFTKVQAQQLLPKPKHLTWEEAGCYTLVLATAYRMLFGHSPHVIKPGMNVLVWGGAGGLGSMAIQIVKAAGANAIAVVSSDPKIDYCMKLGAKAVLNRKNFGCWGQLPPVKDKAGYDAWVKEARKFGKAIWDVTGKGMDVDIVFEHPGESTFPVSTLVCKKGGMVVFCAGTTGYNLTMDARYIWMRQKRIQGSHFANAMQARAANQMVIDKQVDPCLSEVFSFDATPDAHDKMWKNQHANGNMAILVGAPSRGLKTLDDSRAATRGRPMSQSEADIGIGPSEAPGP
jgi:crotonyl-CoA carboxylase/reductase